MPFENIVGKGENAEMFSTHPKTNYNFSITFILSSARAFKLDQSENIVFGRVNPFPNDKF